ncbi:MAG: hypothetical protein IJ048_07890 [Clostridia bacterium]|nr:hypothetical protein [Clostridia bacterium]
MKYVLGIDQGGTKTHALVSDENGRILGVGRDVGGCHSIDGMEQAMRGVRGAAQKRSIWRASRRASFPQSPPA